MRELSLFTGAGGGLLGTMLLGWEPIGYVEWDEYCQRVIAARVRDGYLPAAPIFGDIREFIKSGAAAEYRGFADVVTAGFPCQPHSYAGKLLGGEDERDMWPFTIECIRLVQPRVALLENVTGLLSGYIGRVIGDLASSGYSAKWDCIPAAIVGAPHIRDRVFIVANANGQPIQKQDSQPEETTQDTSPGGDFAGLGLAEHRASEAKAVFCGMDDAVAHRMDRLRAIGNGQVPAVVRRAWLECG